MLASGRPVLVVRAHLRAAELAEFRRWHRAVHMPNMLAIPGVIGGRTVARAAEAPANWLAIFEFAANAEIQAALQSWQAQRAREDWGRWSDSVSNLSIEIYAELAAFPAYHHWD